MNNHEQQGSSLTLNFFFWMQVFCGHRETGELQLKKSSLKETGDVHLIKHSILYCMPGAHDGLLCMGIGLAR